MLIDSHTHLYLREFDSDRDEMLQRAIDVGVGKFYLPNIDAESASAMLEMEARHSQQCHAMMGVHPGSVKDDYKKELDAAGAWLAKRPFAAIGEIGIDLYWDKTFIEEQKDAFSTQIEWAKDLGLPVVIHSRNSMNLVIELLKEAYDERLRGILHCFTGNLEQARQLMELGFYMGIGGIITYKNAGLAGVVRHIPLEYLVLETDSPYLPPVPHRGKRNESAYLRFIAEKLAETKNLGLEAVAVGTTTNVEKIFSKKA
ncbi:MAG: TatD family hydrolase [Saprospiraceae bacterium]